MWWRRIFGFSQAEGGQSEAAPSVGNPSDIDSDSPIRTPDEDRFGVDHFAQLIAKSVAAQAGAEGTVIAITAPWGGGKSSVVNLTEYHLQQEHAEVLIIRFNPWWFTGSDALAQAFMSTLASALDRSLGDRGEEAVRAFLARMTRIETYKRAAVKAAEDGWARGTAALLFGNRTVEEEHAALSRALAQQSQHIVIVIDDIDRLSPDESLLIFGLLKSVGRLPNVTYLLAFDRLLVERLLLERYPSEGAQYLEKILQATFDLPPVASDVLRSMVEDELGSMFQIPEGDAVEFLNLFHDVVVPKLTSARQAKRYLGSLKVTWPSVAGEVKAADFMAIEAIRVFTPSLYAAVRQNGGVLRRDEPDYLSEEQERQRADRIFLDILPEAERPWAKAALERLFPKTQGIWGNMSFGDTWQENWDRSRSICSERHFATYFQYSLDPDAIPKEVRDRIVQTANDGKTVGEVLLAARNRSLRDGRTQASVMLEEIRLLAPDIERQDVEPLLRSIFSVADELDVREDREKGFEFANNTLRIHWLMNTILEKWTIEERSELLRKAAPAAQLGWLLDLANRCERPYKKEASADDQKEPLVSQSVAAEIRNLAHTRLREAAAAQQILLNPRARNLIWLLANLEPDGPKLVKRVTNRALKTAEGTAALADALTTISWSQTLGMFGPGDRVARGTPRVQRDGLDKMVDQKKLHAQVQRFTSDPATTPADRLKLERFLTGWQTSNDD